MWVSRIGGSLACSLVYVELATQRHARWACLGESASRVWLIGVDMCGILCEN